MINLLCPFRHDDHPICLNQEFRLDLTWWRELFHRWDGLSFFLMLEWAPLPDFQVSSDAAGTLGYGAIFQHQWFCGPSSASQQPLSIAYKDLFPIVVLHTCEVLNGLLGESSSSATTSRWWLFSLLVPPETLN